MPLSPRQRTEVLIPPAWLAGAEQLRALGTRAPGAAGRFRLSWRPWQGWPRPPCSRLCSHRHKPLVSAGHTVTCRKACFPAPRAAGHGLVSKLWPTGYEQECFVEVSRRLRKGQPALCPLPLLFFDASFMLLPRHERHGRSASLSPSELERMRFLSGQQGLKQEGTRAPETPWGKGGRAALGCHVKNFIGKKPPWFQPIDSRSQFVVAAPSPSGHRDQADGIYYKVQCPLSRTRPGHFHESSYSCGS